MDLKTQIDKPLTGEILHAQHREILRLGTPVARQRQPQLLRLAQGFLPAHRRHGGDQGAIVKLRGFTAQHHRAVAHHRDVARKLANFRQLVRDKHDPDAERLQRADLAEQAFGFARREGGGRFVEDQDPGVAH